MKAQFLFVLAAVLLLTNIASAQAPDMYNKVTRLTWVVSDADRVVDAWAKLGFDEAARLGQVELASEYRGQRGISVVKWTSGAFGDLDIDVIQPVARDNAFRDYLKKHGDGIMSLGFDTGNKAAFDAELKRLKAAGAEVLQRGKLDLPGIAEEYAFLDTGEEGKYAIRLSYGTGEPRQKPPRSSGVRVRQFAFVVSDLSPVSAYWHKLGFPEFVVTHPTLTNLQYHGRPAHFEQDLGWQYQKSVAPYEWCVPPKGSPTVYADYLKRHGAGFHHIAFQMPDMDQAIEHYRKLGYKVMQSGGWGEEGKPGSGRFAYIDSDRFGGVTIELLWNYR